MPHVLSELQLRRLTEHKYSATGSSILEPVMQKFWRWIVEQIPLWWAPNAITLTGLFCNVVTTLILCYYSSDLQGKVSHLRNSCHAASGLTVIYINIYI